MEALTLDRRTKSFWAVVILSLPTFAALLIELSAIVHPNVSAYLLIPLTVIAPGGFLGAIAVAAVSRHSMGRQFFRAACVVLAFALFAGIAAIAIVRLD